MQNDQEVQQVFDEVYQALEKTAVSCLMSIPFYQIDQVFPDV